jgi:menaquinone-dependent protoporphyrinogen IX oxidase
MKQIARKAAAPTNTSRDFEFTDWVALDRFAAEAAPAVGTPATAISCG